MDSASCYLLKIHLLGNRKKARKDLKCFTFEMVVDSDLSNYKDFIESVTYKYPAGYLEVAHVQYYDIVLKNFSEVKSDHDLMSMFDIYYKEKVAQMFVSYCDPSKTFEPITEWDFVGEGQPENTVQNEDDYPEDERVGVHEETMYLTLPLDVLRKGRKLYQWRLILQRLRMTQRLSLMITQRITQRKRHMKK